MCIRDRYNIHPEWFVTYGDQLYFDPALPESRQMCIRDSPYISDAGKGGSPQLITEEPMEEPVYKVVEVMPEDVYKRQKP